MSNVYYIGWDVGGWNCDKNNNSKDAIVILDSTFGIIGKPFRGNLRDAINKATTCSEWINELFKLCQLTTEYVNQKVVIAIDTPLGYSASFIELITSKNYQTENIGNHSLNPYLFRKTELLLFENGHHPLSSIKDMIGSQSTKGIHVLAKFANKKPSSTGVWIDASEQITFIETYPAICKSLLNIELNNQDIIDAYICAKVAQIFDTEKDILEVPDDRNIPEIEGWIWALKKNNSLL